jgi:hypothetical protein
MAFNAMAATAGVLDLRLFGGSVAGGRVLARYQHLERAAPLGEKGSFSIGNAMDKSVDLFFARRFGIFEPPVRSGFPEME